MKKGKWRVEILVNGSWIEVASGNWKHQVILAGVQHVQISRLYGEALEYRIIKVVQQAAHL